VDEGRAAVVWLLGLGFLCLLAGSVAVMVVGWTWPALMLVWGFYFTILALGIGAGA
jgi:hypothetical protein